MDWNRVKRVTMVPSTWKGCSNPGGDDRHGKNWVELRDTKKLDPVGNWLDVEGRWERGRSGGWPLDIWLSHANDRPNKIEGKVSTGLCHRKVCEDLDENHPRSVVARLEWLKESVEGKEMELIREAYSFFKKKFVYLIFNFKKFLTFILGLGVHVKVCYIGKLMSWGFVVQRLFDHPRY